VDPVDVLKAYLLDKGAADLTDGNLLEILKELLRKENHGIHSVRVEECKYIAVEQLLLQSIALGNIDHFARVESRELSSPSGLSLVTGVVVRTRDGNRLVDGYHRLKYSHDSEFLSGTFVVISAIEI
jgi:hypothetical protein